MCVLRVQHLTPILGSRPYGAYSGSATVNAAAPADTGTASMRVPTSCMDKRAKAKRPAIGLSAWAASDED